MIIANEKILIMGFSLSKFLFAQNLYRSRPHLLLRKTNKMAENYKLTLGFNEIEVYRTSNNTVAILYDDCIGEETTLCLDAYTAKTLCTFIESISNEIINCESNAPLIQKKRG